MPNTKETGNKFKKIIVPSKTSTQIASHAKKYFIRQNFLEKRKNSWHKDPGYLLSYLLFTFEFLLNFYNATKNGG